MIERLKDAGLYLAVRIADTATGVPTPTNGGQPGVPTPTSGSVSVPSNLPTGDFQTIIVNVLSWGITIAGSVATLMLFVGGFMYVTAAGVESQLERAKKIIKGAIVGIIVMLLAGVIVTTVNYALLRGQTTGTTGATGTTPTTGTAPTTGTTPGTGIPSFGTNVPSNSGI